jgi:hypothetical protein
MLVVAVPSGVAPSDHLSSAALTAADCAELDGVAFDDGAFVPELPFTPLGAKETSPLDASDGILLDRRSSMVSLLSFETALVPLLQRGLLATDADSAARLCAGFPHDAVLAATTAAARASFVWSPSQFHLIGLNSNRAGLVTTTVNEQRQRRLGIHFDSWDSLPMHMRARCRYRLSVNVGAGDRYFLFMSLSAADVLDALRGEVSVSNNATQLLRMVLRKLPERRVYRLRVPPLWGYVAQTDYLPHDGSTFGAGLYDFSTHALADFRPLKRYFASTSLTRLGGTRPLRN